MLSIFKQLLKDVRDEDGQVPQGLTIQVTITSLGAKFSSRSDDETCENTLHVDTSSDGAFLTNPDFSRRKKFWIIGIR